MYSYCETVHLRCFIVIRQLSERRVFMERQGAAAVFFLYCSFCFYKLGFKVGYMHLN